jgi:hypothetical protein
VAQIATSSHAFQSRPGMPRSRTSAYAAHPIASSSGFTGSGVNTRLFIVLILGSRRTESDVQARVPDPAEHNWPHVRYDVFLVEIRDGYIFPHFNTTAPMQPITVLIEEDERILERSRGDAHAKSGRRLVGEHEPERPTLWILDHEFTDPQSCVPQFVPSTAAVLVQAIEPPIDEGVRAA